MSLKQCIANIVSDKVVTAGSGSGGERICFYLVEQKGEQTLLVPALSESPNGEVLFDKHFYDLKSIPDLVEEEGYVSMDSSAPLASSLSNGSTGKKIYTLYQAEIERLYARYEELYDLYETLLLTSDSVPYFIVRSSLLNDLLLNSSASTVQVRSRSRVAPLLNQRSRISATPQLIASKRGKGKSRAIEVNDVQQQYKQQEPEWLIDSLYRHAEDLGLWIYIVYQAGNSKPFFLLLPDYIFDHWNNDFSTEATKLATSTTLPKVSQRKQSPLVINEEGIHDESIFAQLIRRLALAKIHQMGSLSYETFTNYSLLIETAYPLKQAGSKYIPNYIIVDEIGALERTLASGLAPASYLIFLTLNEGEDNINPNTGKDQERLNYLVNNGEVLLTNMFLNIVGFTPILIEEEGEEGEQVTFYYFYYDRLLSSSSMLDEVIGIALNAGELDPLPSNFGEETFLGPEERYLLQQLYSQNASADNRKRGRRELMQTTIDRLESGDLNRFSSDIKDIETQLGLYDYPLQLILIYGAFILWSNIEL